jgi:hypothetical protein
MGPRNEEDEDTTPEWLPVLTLLCNPGTSLWDVASSLCSVRTGSLYGDSI